MKRFTLMIVTMVLVLLAATVQAQQFNITVDNATSQTNNLDQSGNPVTATPATSDTSSQSQTAASQDASGSPSNSVTLPPEAQGSGYSQEAEIEQEQKGGDQTSTATHSADAKEVGNCVDDACNPKNKNDSHTEIKIVNKPEATVVQGNFLKLEFSGGLPYEGVGSNIATGSAYSGAQSSLNATNAISGVGSITGDIVAGATANQPVSADATSTVTTTQTTNPPAPVQ